MKKKEYISDKISVSDIENWKYNDVILISAPTGRGKSTFIMDKLYGNAKKNNKKILLLSNRDILKKQFEKELEVRENTEIIDIVNYQLIEDRILHNKDISKFKDYDYIVADEAHYFFDDSSFNDTTDLSLEWILNQEDKTRIFMSATSDFLTRYLTGHKKIDIIPYIIEDDYTYIENLYFYEDDEVLKKMLHELPENEKAIYFAPANKAYKINGELDDSSFICSKNNKSYNKYIDEEIRQQIIDKEKFDCQVLCTTTVMDNGINIKDDNVKHIIIDVFDINTIIQCLGRRRIQNIDETINVYIRNCDGQVLSGKKQGIINKIKYPKILIYEGQDILIEKHPRKNYGNAIYEIINKDGQIEKRVNNIMYFKYLNTALFCEELLNKNSKKAYKRRITKELGFNIAMTQDLESVYDAIALQDYLDKFVNIRLFEEEQNELIEIIDLRDSRNRQQKSYKQIKAYIEENTSHTIVRGRDKRRKLKNGNDNPNRDKYYWEIVKTEIV